MIAFLCLVTVNRKRTSLDKADRPVPAVQILERVQIFGQAVFCLFDLFLFSMPNSFENILVKDLVLFSKDQPLDCSSEIIIGYRHPAISAQIERQQYPGLQFIVDLVCLFQFLFNRFLGQMKSVVDVRSFI